MERMDKMRLVGKDKTGRKRQDSDGKGENGRTREAGRENQDWREKTRLDGKDETVTKKERMDRQDETGREN
jgi:hypothetical protein